MNLCALLGLWCSLSGPAYVVDGDTLKIGSQSIRLHGVDAEELREPHGFQAKLAMQTIAVGNITCRDTGERSYKRVVAECIRDSDGVNINAEIIRLGFALDCGHYSGSKYRALEPAGIRLILRQKGYCQ